MLSPASITGKYRKIGMDRNNTFSVPDDDLMLMFMFSLSVHGSEAEPKGSDCYDTFKTMQECFARYPTVYNKTGEDEDGSGIDGATGSTAFSSSLADEQKTVETVDQLDEAEGQPPSQQQQQ